jgi:anti-sigma factor RsiW
MRDSGSAADDLRCIEFVGAVTDYLEGDVNDEDRRRIDRHLEHCRGCQAALAQFQAVIGLAGRLSAVDVTALDPLIRDRLMTALRRPRRP